MAFLAEVYPVSYQDLCWDELQEAQNMVVVVAPDIRLALAAAS
jgi:hypothetical protein